MAQEEQKSNWSRGAAEEARRLQLQASRRVDGLFAGAYRSRFRGPGIDFEEVREYQPGDDVRSIDWNITARSGRPFVKLYAEEREITIAILADRSASLADAAICRSRSRTAAEVCALLIYAAMHSNDRVGLTTFTDRIERHLAPAKGPRHARHLVAELLRPPAGSGTDLALALQHAARVQKHRAVVIVVSDFLAGDFAPQMADLAQRHDVLAISVRDRLDRELPDVGVVRVAGAESCEKRLVDCASASVREAYRRRAEARLSEIERGLTAAGVEHLAIDTGGSSLQALTRFFAGRRLRRSH